jgi:small acid-soluble spore protein H (minor)
MQLERVSEILKSPDNIEVLYNNNPVWIDDIDEDKKTASVRFLNSDETLEVPVNELEETGRSLEFR